MSETHGFVDLRLGHGSGGIGDDSVWPSFTDIMTVIVMIFLMALVVIMVRNFELDRELSSTTEARNVTTRINQDLANRLIQIEASLSATESEKDVLETDLGVALERLSALLLEQQSLTTNIEKAVREQEQLQQANTLLEQQKATAQSEISTLTTSEQTLSQEIKSLIVQLSVLKLESSEQIANLADDKTALHETIDAASLQLAEVRLALEQSRAQNATLTQQVTELETLGQDSEQKYRVASEDILALAALIKQRVAENAALQAQAAASAQQFRSLQEEYDALNETYRDLIRPARSAAGKQVATVWIEKSATGLQYKMTQPDQTEPQIVSVQQMHQTLQTLKEKFSNLLYIKIIIPKNSGLSYDEAADATQDVLQKYDYYFQ